VVTGLIGHSEVGQEIRTFQMKMQLCEKYENFSLYFSNSCISIVTNILLSLTLPTLAQTIQNQGRNLRGVLGGGGAPPNSNHPDWQGNQRF
jgi:hypothetical protein